MSREGAVQLSTDEKVALRRVAHGCSGIALAHRTRLLTLKLVEPCRDELRLTALGRDHFRSLPVAALLSRFASRNAITFTLENVMKRAERSKASSRTLLRPDGNRRL